MISERQPVYPWWLFSVICMCSLVLFANPIVGAEDSQQWSPNMEIFEIIPSPDNTTEQIRVIPKRKNSEIIVGEDVGPQSRLVIKCNATFPVQIVYIGAGRPEFTTFTNVQWREDPQKPLTFEAEASLGLLGFQGALRSEDTGNYSCRSIQNATIFSYFYIYVPGPSLFTPPDDYNSELYFTPRDKEIWIPCTAAHPKAIVSLHKTSSGRLECPAVGRNLATYNPHKGFLFQLKDKRPEGVYLCIGSQNENFRMMEYKLIATNSNQSESGKHPCRPSPCGQKAECSVLDGHPICYCFRGLSGNPYGECSINKDRCHSNADCLHGKFCVMGKCTNDPCQPSPCGRGSTCVSQGGRPRCSCQIGYDGKPPYCLRKCQFHGDCPQEEICSRSHCQDPCPNRCGSGAECQVIQPGRFNRTVICLCPPGTTGDPEENCYDIGAEPGGGQQIHCPLGFIGPGPPNCRRKECAENYDCPPNHYCTADKRCIEYSSRPGEGDNCGRICGMNAICQLGRSGGTSSAKPVCTCPYWATGDPFIRCFNLTTTTTTTTARPPFNNNNWNTNTWNATAVPYPPPPSSTPQDPCNPSPCPRNSICRVKRVYGRIFIDVNDVACECPPGKTGQPPNCYTIEEGQEHGGGQRPVPIYPTEPPQPAPIQCFEDPDCPRGFECVARLCIPADDPEVQLPQCRRRCGLNSQCIRGQCICPQKLVGDPHIACRAERAPCNPSPCANFAECREINGKAACRCILGYEGDAFTRCAPSQGENLPEPREGGGRGGGRDGGSRRNWPSSSRNNNNNEDPSFNPNFVVDAERNNYPHHRFSSDSGLRHSPQPTNSFNTINNVGGEEETNFPRRAGPQTQRPITGQTPPLNTRPKVRPNQGHRGDECDMASKDDCGPPDYQCQRRKDGVAKCICSSHRCGYSPEERPGNIPDGVIYGRYCSINEDCRYPEICSNLTLNCYNPCSYENSPCAHVAFSECRVVQGSALCTCRRGYVGNPGSGLDCRRDFPASSSSSVSSQDPLNSVAVSGSQNRAVVHCDFKKGVGCENGIGGECRLVVGGTKDDGDKRGQCVCGPGLVGEFPDCRLRCKINRDCYNAHECWREECRDPCERNPCGNNAFCRVIDHTPTCECNPGTVGDPWVRCIPNIRDDRKRQKGFLLKCEGSNNDNCKFF